MVRRSAYSRGYNTQWQDIQRAHIKRHPLCIRCGHRGEMVDHVVPINKDPSLRLDPTNLQTMCNRCHAIKTQRKDFGKSSGVMPDTNYLGWPTDKDHPWNQ